MNISTDGKVVSKISKWLLFSGTQCITEITHGLLVWSEKIIVIQML